MYQAYANHRPFVLSPDMIWLLINQGFARHVNANQESMRDLFVDFSGKQSLIVKANKKLEDPTLSWEEIFPQFTNQISNHTGSNLVETLTCNFSTTTSLEKVASEITIMETMKPYFEFIVMYIVCGIPEITLEGTPEDWEKVLDKARRLKEYKLEWWISELEPLLEEFVKNRTVYGSGSTILQYFHSLNILRVNSIYITRETIDDIKRFVISESLYATNFYLYAGTGVTTCFHNVYTGDFTLQRFGGVSGGTFG